MNPHLHALFWIGLMQMVAVLTLCLVPVWQKAIMEASLANTKPLIGPFLLTSMMVMGITLSTLGAARTEGNVNLHGDSTPKPAFLEQVKADDAAVKPQTREELEAERKAQEDKLKEETQSEAQKFQQFREEMQH